MKQTSGSFLALAWALWLAATAWAPFVRAADEQEPLAPEEAVERALAEVHEAMNAPGSPEAVARAVDAWEPVLRSHPDHPGAREAVLHLLIDLGRVHLEADRTDEAREIFTGVAAEAGGSSWGERAEGFLYELEHLNVGQPAPAFQATTLDGEALTHESLPGRLTVLSFWATY